MPISIQFTWWHFLAALILIIIIWGALALLRRWMRREHTVAITVTSPFDKYDALGIVYKPLLDEFKILPFKIYGNLAYYIDTRSKNYYIISLNPKLKFSRIGSKPAFFAVVSNNVGMQINPQDLVTLDVLVSGLAGVKKGDKFVEDIDRVINDIIVQASERMVDVDEGPSLGFGYKIVLRAPQSEAAKALLLKMVDLLAQIVNTMIDIENLIVQHDTQLLRHWPGTRRLGLGVSQR